MPKQGTMPLGAGGYNVTCVYSYGEESEVVGELLQAQGKLGAAELRAGVSTNISRHRPLSPVIFNTDSLYL